MMLAGRLVQRVLVKYLTRGDRREQKYRGRKRAKELLCRRQEVVSDTTFQGSARENMAAAGGKHTSHSGKKSSCARVSSLRFQNEQGNLITF